MKHGTNQHVKKCALGGIHRYLERRSSAAPSGNGAGRDAVLGHADMDVDVQDQHQESRRSRSRAEQQEAGRRDRQSCSQQIELYPVDGRGQGLPFSDPRGLDNDDDGAQAPGAVAPSAAAPRQSNHDGASAPGAAAPRQDR